MYRKFVVPREAIDYLKNVDKNIKEAIEEIGDIEDREITVDPFWSIVNTIIYQQISMAVGKTVSDRFLDLVETVNPQNILKFSDEDIQKCGLSFRKVSYIKDLCEKVIIGEVYFDKLDIMSDKEIIDMLVKVKGLGVWSAEMFLIFTLGRMDVLSYNDLAIKRGLKILYNLDDYPSKEKFKDYERLYSPYNTIASFYLWHISIEWNNK